MFNDPYLIQRMSFNNKLPEGFGLDALCRYEYMGSAEFEFGALPDSLKQMCRKADDLEVVMVKDIVNQENQRLCLVVPVGAADNYRPIIDALIEEKIRLKESANFAPHVTGKSRSGEPVKEGDWYLDTKGWWDLNNHVMFTFGKQNAKNILKAIRNVRDRKKAANEKEWY